ARLERSEPAAEASELIRRQLGNSFGDFFDLHVTQYTTWLSDGKLRGLGRRRLKFDPKPPSVWSSQRLEVIAPPIYRWVHCGFGNRGFPEATSSGQTTACWPSCHWIVIGL